MPHVLLEEHLLLVNLVLVDLAFDLWETLGVRWQRVRSKVGMAQGLSSGISLRGVQNQ